MDLFVQAECAALSVDESIPLEKTFRAGRNRCAKATHEDNMSSTARLMWLPLG